MNTTCSSEQCKKEEASMFEARHKPDYIAEQAWNIMFVSTLVQILTMQIATGRVWSFSTLWMVMWVVTVFFSTITIALLTTSLWRTFTSGIVMFMLLQGYIEYLNGNLLLVQGFEKPVPYIEGPLSIAIVGSLAAILFILVAGLGKFRGKLSLPFVRELAK